MTEILVIGGVSYNMQIFLDEFPAAQPATIFSRYTHETVGSTGAGKALNLHVLGVTMQLHGLMGADVSGQRIRDYLDRAGVPFLYDIDHEGSKQHVNLMIAAGERISVFLINGAAEPDTILTTLTAVA